MFEIGAGAGVRQSKERSGASCLQEPVGRGCADADIAGTVDGQPHGRVEVRGIGDLELVLIRSMTPERPVPDRIVRLEKRIGA